MPVTNYKDTLVPGVAFEIHLDGVPVRRGIIVCFEEGKPMAWFQHISVYRAPGESQDLKPLNFNLEGGTFQRATISPVPEPFTSWLKKVPAQVRLACGEARGRPGPKRKVQPSDAGDMIHPQRADKEPLAPDVKREDHPGCSPPDSPIQSRKGNSAPMAHQLAALRGALDDMGEKLDTITRITKKIKKSLKSPHK